MVYLDSLPVDETIPRIIPVKGLEISLEGSPRAC